MGNPRVDRKQARAFRAVAKATPSFLRSGFFRKCIGRVPLVAAVVIFIFVWFGRHAIVGRAIATSYGGEYQGQRDVVLQQGLRDCGVAALTMMLSAHFAPLTDADSLRDMVRHRARGLSFLELQRAARTHGVILEGYRLSTEGLVHAPMPLIAHLFHHFVVVDGVDNGRVMVRDPIAGRITIPIEQFALLWSGNVLSALTDAPTDIR